jgi:hypothetical protein
MFTLDRVFRGKKSFDIKFKNLTVITNKDSNSIFLCFFRETPCRDKKKKIWDFFVLFMRNIFLTFWQVASSLTSLKTSPEFDVVSTLKRRRCCSQTRGRVDCPELKTMTTILNPGDESFQKRQKMKFYSFETKNNIFPNWN